MRNMPILLLILGAAACSAASAQWIWRDAGGKQVFSDRPPPADVPAHNVLRQPAPAQRSAAATAAPSSPTAAPNAPAAPDGQDKELQQRRQNTDAAELAKQQAAQAAQARAQADNCARARQAKANLDSGMRIARVNPQGEREILDDSARSAEARRAQDIMARDCEPGRGPQ